MIWYLHILQKKGTWLAQSVYTAKWSPQVLLTSVTTCSEKSFFLIMRAFKIYSLSDFQIWNTVLLTIVTMLTLHPYDIYFITGSLYLLTSFTILPTPTAHQSVLCICEFIVIFFKIVHIREIIWYLSFSFWLTWLSIIPSRSIHIVTNGKMLNLNSWSNFLCYLVHVFRLNHVKVPFINLLILSATPRLHPQGRNSKAYVLR